MSFATTRLGQVAQAMIDDGERRDIEALRITGEICLRRGMTGEDPDFDALVRALLYTYANSAGICVSCLPTTHTH